MRKKYLPPDSAPTDAPVLKFNLDEDSDPEFDKLQKMIDDRENTADNEQAPTLPAEDAFLLLEQERRELEMEEQKLEAQKIAEGKTKKKAGTRPAKQR